MDPWKFDDAVLDGQCDVVDDFLASGYIPEPKVIWRPRKTGDVDMLTRLLRYPMDLGSGLRTAVEYGHIHILNHLFTAGVNVAEHGSNILYSVTDVQACKWLLDMGATQTLSQTGYTPLHHACRNQRFEIAKLLLQHHSSRQIQMLSDSGETPLNLTCKAGNLEMVKLLIKYVMFTSNSTSSPNSAFPNLELDLELEPENLTTQQKQEVIEKCHLLVPGKYGYFPIHNACKSGNVEIVRLLLDYGVDINLPDAEECFTPLHHACSNGHVELTRYLLQRGALEIPSKQGHYPLHQACFNRHLEVAKILLDNGSKQLPNVYNYTPMTIAEEGSKQRRATTEERQTSRRIMALLQGYN